MIFRAEEYFLTSGERMNQAQALFQQGRSYALAVYCAGLAVECMLRAFRWRREPAFEGRHDLLELLKASNLLSLHDEHMRKQRISEDDIAAHALELRAACNKIYGVWHNNLRFASERRLRAHFQKLDLLQGAKGDALRKNSRELLDAAWLMIDWGTAVWTSRRK